MRHVTFALADRGMRSVTPFVRNRDADASSQMMSTGRLAH